MKILVVANETVGGAALRRELLDQARRGRVEVFIVCPALNSRLRHWLSDEDSARNGAHERLEASLASLKNAGIDASGTIGSADPVQALEDALGIFSADHVIISTHPPGRSNWLEKDVVARARRRFRVPISHVLGDGSESAAAQLEPPAAITA